MLEIEVKILNINRKEIEKKLASLGAKKVFDGEITASFFDFLDKSIRNNKQAVRLRKVGDQAFLTTKTPVSNKHGIKIQEELEIEVINFSRTKEILETLGLLEWMSIKKSRISYLLNNIHFEFDKYHEQYEFIPEFLEIETKDTKAIFQYVELLGFKRQDCKPWTLLDLVKHFSSLSNQKSKREK